MDQERLIDTIDGILIDDIHKCLVNLRVHNNPEFYFKDFLPLLTENELCSLVEYDADTAVSTGAYNSQREYLLDTYEIDKPTPVSSEEVARLISKILFCSLYDGGHEEGVQYILNILDTHLANPQLCAQIMSRKSLFQVSMPVIRQEVESIRKEGQRLLKKMIARKTKLQNSQGHNLEEYDHENIVSAFLDECSIDAWEHREDLWQGYQYIYKRANVEGRHPLFATSYCLYVPPVKRLRIADPIEQIILESTKNPSLIRKLTPRQFEEFLAKIFESFGFEVQLTARTRDGGADILCMSTRHNIPVKLAIEAKRYHPSRPVTVDLVRKFIGANALLRANKLVYVTTSRYTRDAVRYATSPFVIQLLELKEFPDIVRWANEFQEQRFHYVL